MIGYCQKIRHLDNTNDDNGDIQLIIHGHLPKINNFDRVLPKDDAS